VAEANTVHVAGDNAVELDQWPVERLEREITELAAHLNAAECRWLVLWPSSTGARGGPPGSAGHVPTGSTGSAGSISAPPARRCGSLTLSVPAPRYRGLRRRAVELFEGTGATRVATPENEPQLLELALTGTAAHLERIVRAYRGALRADEVANANRVHERRGVQWFHDDDGSLVLTARLEPETGRARTPGLGSRYRSWGKRFRGTVFPSF
jgi:hypothetical protein